MSDIAILAIDGPSASGKGTVAQRVAEALGFAYLDSGALYRLSALAAREAGVSWDDEAGVAAVAASLDVRFAGGLTLLNNLAVDDLIRSEAIGTGASKIAAFPLVRQALLARQRAFAVAPTPYHGRQPPGPAEDFFNRNGCGAGKSPVFAADRAGRAGRSGRDHP